MTRTKKIVTVVLGLLLALVLVYLVLPILLLQSLNRRLQSIPGYDAHVRALELSWLKPGVTFHHVNLAKREKTAPGALVSAERVHVQLSGRALLRRELVMDITVEKPDMTFLMRERRVGQPKPLGIWRDPFVSLPPFRVHQAIFRDGSLRFDNADAIPPIHVFFDALTMSVTHVANSIRMKSPGPSLVKGEARMQGQAPVTLSMTLDPFAEDATFTVAGTLKRFDLVAMNPAMRHYTGLTLARGSLTMQADLAIHDGRFKGRIQRSIHDLTIEKKQRTLLKAIKEDVAQAWLNWHEDNDTQRIEKTFDYEGPLGYLEDDLVLAAVWVIKGAFIQALKAKVDDKVVTVLPEQALDEWAQWQAKERKKAKRD